MTESRVGTSRAGGPDHEESEPPADNLLPSQGRANAVRGHIAIQSLDIVFDAGTKGSVHALQNVTLDIPEGQFISVLGPSGCGKSTLLNAVAGFIAPTNGMVRLDDRRITAPGADRGVVFQQPALFPWKTVLQNIALGPRMAGLKRREAEAKARHFMELVGLGAFGNHYPETLSGGMQQRVGIARTLANQPSVFLMDEPFGALDAQTRELMQENLLKIWEELRTTLVFVTHDIEEAIFLAERVVLMSARPGRIIADITVDIPRPRSPDVLFSPEFTRVKKRCRDLIRVESIKAFEQQNQVNPKL